MRCTTCRGWSTIETVVAISIAATLAILFAPTATSVQQGAVEAQCRTQLWEIGAALARYRDDHNGQDPPVLPSLVPDYIAAAKLICPITQRRAPRQVARMQQVMQATPARHWATYFLFRRRGIDDLYTKGKIPFGYSQILAERRGATPVVVCFDHAQPWSLAQKGLADADMLQSWYRPERGNMVLRRSGRVEVSRYGGMIVDATDVGTLACLAHL
jgi:type II secretory pathway pseudopilin PulG